VRGVTVVGMSSTETRDGLPVMAFPSTSDWERWLADQPRSTRGVWLKLAKKESGLPGVSRADAIDGALCHGWIDGQPQKYDERYWLIRFTPRSAGSWVVLPAGIPRLPSLRPRPILGVPGPSNCGGGIVAAPRTGVANAATPAASISFLRETVTFSFTSQRIRFVSVPGIRAVPSEAYFLMPCSTSACSTAWRLSAAKPSESACNNRPIRCGGKASSPALANAW